MFTPTNHVVAWPDLHRARPLALSGFSQDLPAKYRWRKRKVSPSERADPAPRGGILGPCPPTGCFYPPNENCAPPSEDCASKKLPVSGLLERNARPEVVFFVDWHWTLWRFWDENLFFIFFFFEIFFCFLEIIGFRPVKPLEIPIAAGKSLEIFAPHLVHFIQSGIKISCPPAPLGFTQNKLLVPPKIYFCPPVTLS